MADPVVHITAGIPDSGTGNITTLGQTLLDGANATIGAQADAKAATTDATPITAMSVWKQISASIQAAAASLAGTLTVGTHAVTGTFFQATQPVSAATLPLPTGASTAAKQPALGTAGSASTDVITVQGIASGTPAPISGTVTANAGTNLNTSTLALEAGGNLAAVLATAGATTGAAVVTDANGTIQQYLRGLVKNWASALGAGTAAAALRTTLASDDPAVATLGATTGAAVITDANGTIQQYLRGLIKQWIAGTLVLGTSSNVIGHVVADTGSTTAVTGNVSVKPAACTTGTQSIVASSATDVTILASNAARLGGSVYNDSASATLYLLLANATSSTTVYSTQLPPNAYFEIPFGYTQVLKGIWSAAVGNARVMEYTA